MLKKVFVDGRIISQYSISLEHVKNLNMIFDKEKDKLSSYGSRLAGRLETELSITDILQSSTIYPFLTECMFAHITKLQQHNCTSIVDPYNLNIISAWINDMKEGEYNPPHTHHNGTGFSVVLFLNIPEYINDVKDPHKFHDGQLGFGGFENQKIWIEPEVGDFFIFNANHTHYVMPFKVKTKGETRRSMSFNFIATPIGKNEKK